MEVLCAKIEETIFCEVRVLKDLRGKRVHVHRPSYPATNSDSVKVTILTPIPLSFQGGLETYGVSEYRLYPFAPYGVSEYRLCPFTPSPSLTYGSHLSPLSSTLVSEVSHCTSTSKILRGLDDSWSRQERYFRNVTGTFYPRQ